MNRDPVPDAFYRDAEPSRLYVAFSGGVDSTALALLESEAVPIFADTGWEFPQIYAHQRRFFQTTERPVVRVSRDGETLPEYIESHHFMPGHASRFCTRLFKIEPINKYLKQRLPCTLMIGLRADEPETVRAGNLTELPGLTIRYPLRERGLTRVDVVRICIEHDLLPVYPPYMARGGCVGCFYKRGSEVRAMAELVPVVVDELERLETAVQDEREHEALMFPNMGISIARLRRQARLMDTTELYRDASDRSDMGAECGLFCGR